MSYGLGSIEAKALVGSSKGSSEQNPVLINVTTKKKDDGGVPYIAFASDNSFIVTGSYDKKIRIWNRFGALLRELELPYLDAFTKNGIRGIAVHPKSNLIISTNRANLIQIWSKDESIPLHTIRFEAGVDILQKEWGLGILVPIYGFGKMFHGMYKKEQLCDEDIPIAIFDKYTFCGFRSRSGGFFCDLESTQGILIEHSENIRNCVIISKNGKIISGNDKNDIVIYNQKTKKLLKLPDHTAPVKALALSADDRYLVSGSDDKTVRVWDIERNVLVKTLQKHTHSVIGVGVTPDSRFIVSAGRDKAIHIWELATGALLKSLQRHSAPIESMAISLDGQYVATGDEDGSMLLWNLPKLIHEYKKENKEEQEKDNSRLLELYLKILADPSLISLPLLQEMFSKVTTLEAFKLPYTLACVELRQNKSNINELRQTVFKCLDRLAETTAVCPAPNADQKDSSKQGSYKVAQYKLALESAHKKGFIDRAQQFYLDNQAEDHKTFSDERFTALKQEVQNLKSRVETTEHNILVVTQNLENLKKALKTKAQRNMLISIAKIGVGFIAGPLIDCFAHVFDLSDVAELGATLLKTNVDEWHRLVAKGAEFAKKHVDSAVGTAMANMGYDPEALVNAWVETSISLESVSVSVTVSSERSSVLAAAPSSVPAMVSKTQSTVDTKAIDLSESEAIRTFKQKLTALIKHEDGGFAFQIKRAKFNCLQLQFTAADQILMTPDDIRKELVELIKLFKQAVADLDIKLEQYKVEPNWKDWTLSVTAEPNILNKIGELLLHAGANYFQSAPQAKDILLGTNAGKIPSAAPAGLNTSQPTVSCVMQ